MPLSMVSIGEKKQIIKVRGKDCTRKFLNSLGFVEGTDITIVSVFGGNMIVNVKDTRVAIDRAMAHRIMVW